MREAELKCWQVENGIALFSPEQGRIIGEIRQGQLYHRSQRDLDLCISWLAGAGGELSIARFKMESEFRDHICDVLRDSGYKVAKEYYTSQGRIDLLAEKEGTRSIIETKLSNDSHSMAHALGQLLFYSKFIPDASLWVCTLEKPDSTILSILSSFNVNFLEIDNE